MESKYPELTPARIKAALQGDRTAFAELYRCYRPRVHASVAAALRFRAELVRHCEDIQSEVWARLLANGCRQLQSFDPRRGAFGYYLHMRAWALARMLAAQALRRDQVVELDDPFVALIAEDGLEDRITGRDELERLYALVEARLDPVDLTFFHEVYVKGRRIEEVGREVELAKDAAFRRSHRLRKKLQRIAEELHPDPTPDPTPKPPIPIALLIAFVALAEGLSDFPLGTP